jgi:XTP/dITP diphosphohydrolase
MKTRSATLGRQIAAVDLDARVVGVLSCACIHSLIRWQVLAVVSTAAVAVCGRICLPPTGRSLAAVPIPPEPAVPTSSRRLLIATTNPHKIEEFREILAGLPYKLVTPNDLGLALEVEETGTTFAENAVLKATAWADVANMMALADDSGLEIDALGGAPGIYSARWAGEDVSYEERFRILLERLADVPAERRTARYRAAIAIAEPAPGGLLGVVQGTLEGQIAFAPAGSGGFGYDPIFYVPEQERTVGQMSAAEKQRISHRARAAAAARELLQHLAEMPSDGESSRNQAATR